MGRAGEKTALKFLKKKKYKILERNYSTRFGEADIIAEIDGIIVFVEVKTRLNRAFGRPLEAVDSFKQMRYRKIAEYYLYTKRISDTLVRFDVIEVEGTVINHFEDAFK